MLRPLLLALTTAAAVTPQCGSSSSTTPGTTSVQNFQSIVVNAGPANNYFNGAFTTVTICVPGAPIAECAQFLDGFTWGPVQTADIRLGGEQASAVPIQVIGSPAFTNIPASCSSAGTPEDTLDALGANGIL